MSPRTSRLAASAMLVVLVAVLSACQISWSAGHTHGAIIEPNAVRASVGIWRAPSRLLFDVEQAQGVDAVQTILCAVGKFPPVRLSVGSRSISDDVFSRRWCGYVQGDDADLRGALHAAQGGRRDECLALTLISRGAYIKNWTHKSGGCKTGSLS